MVVKGLLCKVNRTAKTFEGKKGEEKLYITVSNVELSADDMETVKKAYKEVGKKLTPSWVLDFEGYVNVATKFEVPAKWINGAKYDSIEDLIADHPEYYNAPVRMSLVVKDGAIYPKAVVFDGEGEEFDPFADFE